MRRVWAIGFLVLLAGGGCSDDGGKSDAAVEAGGGGEEGFGDYCSAVAKPCKAGFFCSKEMGEPFGFCTKQCPVQGETCSGAPTGTRAECWMKLIPSGYACAFFCSDGSGGTQSIGCPPDLQCRTDKSVGGGLYRCLP